MRATVFLSYSRQDSGWKDRLALHLQVLEKQGILDVWDTQRTSPGENWRDALEEAIGRSSVAVLLISADYLASDSTSEIEAPLLIEQSTAGRIRLVPILVKSCLWQAVPWLAGLQVRPSNDRPLASGNAHQVDLDLFHISLEIKKAVGDRLIEGLGLRFAENVTPSPGHPRSQRDWSANDLAMLEFFYSCFDRAAFRIPFVAEVPKELFQAIDDTILTLGTGIKKTRSGLIFDRGRPKAHFEDAELRTCFDAISSHLHDIKKVYDIASLTEQLDVRSGVVIRRDPAIPAIIDGKRNLILKIVNEVYAELGRAPFPIIPDDLDDKFDLFKRLRQQFWDESKRPEVP